MPEMTLEQAFKTFEKHYGTWRSNRAYHPTTLSTLTYLTNKYRGWRSNAPDAEDFIRSLDRAFSDNDVRNAFYKLAKVRHNHPDYTYLLKGKLSPDEINIVYDAVEQTKKCLPISKVRYSWPQPLFDILTAPQTDEKFFKETLHWPEGMLSFYVSCGSIFAHLTNQFSSYARV